MTVPAQVRQAIITYNIRLDNRYEIKFPYLDNDEYLSVYLIRNDGTRDNLTLDTDYYITSANGLNDVHGHVNVIKRLDFSYAQICIYRNVKNDQSTPFEDNQTLFASSIEHSLDKLTMLYQDNFFEGKNTDYKAGKYIDISEDNVISATRGVEYTAGENINVFGTEISCDVLNTVISKKEEDFRQLVPITTLPSQYDYVSVCYYNNAFYAIAYNEDIVTYSKDGIVWKTVTEEEKEIPLLPEKFEWSFLCAGDVVLALNDKNQTQYYLSGNKWNKIDLPNGIDRLEIVWRDVLYNEYMFLALCDAGIFMFRYENSEFKCKKVSVKDKKDAGDEVDCRNINCLAHGFIISSYVFLAMGNGVIYKAVRSKTTEVEFEKATGKYEDYNFISACFGNEEFHAVAMKDSETQLVICKVEKNNITIKSTYLNYGTDLKKIFYSNKTFFITYTQSDILLSFKSYTSPIEQLKFPYRANWNSIAYGNEKFVFTSRFNLISNQVTDNVKGNFISVATNKVNSAEHMAITDNNTIIKYDSKNKNWNPVDFNIPFIIKTFDHIAGVDGNYMAIGDDGFYKSTDLITWEKAYNYSNGIPTDIVYGNGIFVSLISNKEYYRIKDGQISVKLSLNERDLIGVRYLNESVGFVFIQHFNKKVYDEILVHSTTDVDTFDYIYGYDRSSIAGREDTYKFFGFDIFHYKKNNEIVFSMYEDPIDIGSPNECISIRIIKSKNGKEVENHRGEKNFEGKSGCSIISTTEDETILIFSAITNKWFFLSKEDGTLVESKGADDYIPPINPNFKPIYCEDYWIVKKPGEDTYYGTKGFKHNYADFKNIKNFFPYPNDTEILNISYVDSKTIFYIKNTSTNNLEAFDGFNIFDENNIDKKFVKQISFPETTKIEHINHCNNKYIVSGQDIIAYKSNSENWKFIRNELNIKSILYDGANYIAINYDSIHGKTTIKSSSDLINWMDLYSNEHNYNYIKIISNKSLTVVVGDGIAYSDHAYDSKSWKEDLIGNKFNSIACDYDNDIFVAVGDKGCIYTYAAKTDTEWNKVKLDEKFVDLNIKDIAFDGSVFIAISDQDILYSYDTKIWSVNYFDKFNSINASSGIVTFVGEDQQLICNFASQKNNFCYYNLVRYLREAIDYKAGNGINISDTNVISQINLIDVETASEGDNIYFSDVAGRKAINCKLVAGENITFGAETEDHKVKINTTKYTAGDYITISPEHEISVDNKYLYIKDITIPVGNWHSVTYAAGKFVAVGGDDKVMYSETGTEGWTPASGTIPGGSWHSVTYSADKKLFVAVGDFTTDIIVGKVMYSTTGTDGWTPAEGTILEGSWNSVIYAAGKFVAVGWDGKVMYSETGTEGWTPASGTIPGGVWRSVTYGNSMFVAVGDGKVMYSETGTEGWTPASGTIPGGVWQSVTYSAGKFVAVGINMDPTSVGKVMYSTTGTDGWTPAEGTIPAGSWNSVIYAAGKFVAVGWDDKVMYSETGTEGWTPASGTIPGGNWQSVTYGNSMFVVVGDHTCINIKYINIFNYDGSEYIKIDDETRTIYYAGKPAIEYKAGANIVIADNRISATDSQYTAGDGILINELNIITNTKPAIEYKAGANIVIAEDKTISSTDTQYTAGDGISIDDSHVITNIKKGAEYTAGTNVEISADNVISAVDTTYIAGDNITISGHTISSTDTQYTAGDYITISPAHKISVDNKYLDIKDITVTVEQWTSVIYCKDKFVAVGNGKVMYSTNGGINWTPIATPAVTAGQWTSITYGADKFVAVSNNGKVMYSTNGEADWKLTPADVEKEDWRSIAYGAGKFVAVSYEGHAMHSTTGEKDWIPMAPPIITAGQWTSITYGADKFVAVSGNGNVICSTDGEVWEEAENDVIPEGSWNSVAYGNDMFVAVSYGNIIYSTTGYKDWALAESPIPIGPYGSVACGAGKFIAVEIYGKIIYSTNAINWALAESPIPGGQWTSITYGADKFVAVGNKGNVLIINEANGFDYNGSEYIRIDDISRTISYTGNQPIEYIPGENITISDYIISATDTKYTAGENVSISNGVIGCNVLDTLITKKSGWSISDIEEGISEYRQWHQLANTKIYGKDYLMAIEKKFDSSRIAISDDYGETWKVKTITIPSVSFENYQLSAIGAATGIFTIIAQKNDYKTSFSVVSCDAGETWKKYNYSIDTNINAIAYTPINGNYVSVSSGTKDANISNMYSVDYGRSWAKGIGDSTLITNCVVYGDTNFVSLSDNAKESLISYNNGLNWYNYLINTIAGINDTEGISIITSMAFGLHAYVAVGPRGIIISNEGTIWKKANIGTALLPFTSVTYGNGVFIAFTFKKSYISRDAGETWFEHETLSDGGTNYAIIPTYCNGKFIGITYNDNKCFSCSVDVSLKDML